MKKLIVSFMVMMSALSVSAQVGDVLQGKSIGVIGDSYVRNHKDKIENTWHYKFAKKHGMTYYNYGKNGNCLAVDLPKWGNGVYKRYIYMKDSLDYVIVIGGHNDCSRIDSIGMDTFKSRLSILCKGLIEKYPEAKILFFTPWSCENFETSNRRQVVDAIIEVCGDYSIPVFDCARKSNIFVQSDKFRSIYFQGKGIGDGAHLNSKGHDRFLPVAESFILQYADK